MAEPYLLIKIGDGEEFNIADRISGLHYLGTDDSSDGPQFTNNYEDVSGMDGSWFISQTFAKRTFNEKFWLHWTTYNDFVLAKHDLYQLFATRQLIRVRTDHSPDKVYYGYPAAFNISPLSNGMSDANFTIPFEVPKGVKYSLYRSNELKEAQFGMNLPKEQELSYTYTSNSFKVYNAGDLTVDPYYAGHDLKIYCKYNGSELSLTNTTNGSSWSYSRSGGGTVILDGLTTYYNGANDNVNSDGGTISLDPGWNNFTVGGATTVTFSFPFVYLL